MTKQEKNVSEVLFGVRTHKAHLVSYYYLVKLTDSEWKLHIPLYLQFGIWYTHIIQKQKAKMLSTRKSLWTVQSFTLDRFNADIGPPPLPPSPGFEYEFGINQPLFAALGELANRRKTVRGGDTILSCRKGKIWVHIHLDFR